MTKQLHRRVDLRAALLILIGTATQSAVMIKSGISYKYGMGFWGPNAHDGLWHISLINQLAKFNFTHPSFAGNLIQNYHFGFDLLAALLYQLTRIPIPILYFQILPPLLSLGVGLLMYRLVIQLTANQKTGLWAIFFCYFGGSFGYLVNLIKGHGLGGESAFWSIQSISFPVNPPFMLSLVFLFLGFNQLLKLFKKNTATNFWTTAFIFGLLPIIKVYGGVIILVSLFIFGLLRFLVYRDFAVLKLFLAIFIISMFTFLPLNRNAGGLIKIEPLWFPRTMMEFRDRVGWERFASARQNYMNSRNLAKWIPAELFALTVFLIGNLGTRTIGFVVLLRKNKYFPSNETESASSWILQILTISLFISVIPTLIFVQRGNPWNTIQFFYYTEIIAGIFAAIFISRLSPGISVVLRTSIVLLTIPSTLGTLPNYLPNRPPAAIPSSELKALNFLKKQPPGVVLTYPFKKEDFQRFTEPRPVFAYETTAYVSAISSHQTFIEDEINLEISSYPWRERREQVEKFLSDPDNKHASSFLKRNNIKYLYLLEGQNFSFGPSQTGLTEIYDDPHVVSVYKFDDKID